MWDLDEDAHLEGRAIETEADASESEGRPAPFVERRCLRCSMCACMSNIDVSREIRRVRGGQGRHHVRACTSGADVPESKR